MSEHGTVARYKKHVRDGDPACKACKDANAERGRLDRGTPEAMRRHKQRQIAVRRAYTKLRKMYPLDYRILYEAELMKLEKEYGQRKA